VTRILQNIAEISANYDVIFCDLWGCLHNGKSAYPDAIAALQAYRKSGGHVVLLTNAPRPARSVVTQLESLGAPKDCYDVITTSGDSAQAAMAAGMFGRKVYHIGETPKDDAFFFTDDGTPIDVERVPLDDAEGIICTGLVDDRTETPDDYRHTILTGVNRGLKMLCANPDIIVDVGDQRIYCAGAIGAAWPSATALRPTFRAPLAKGLIASLSPVALLLRRPEQAPTAPILPSSKRFSMPKSSSRFMRWDIFASPLMGRCVALNSLILNIF